ncbi:MAG: FKBP-type peptidyl-prolyl cis-trans isomerase [Rhodanobacter sp.]|nr:MAG: FKBP-type peptidyl-prolyl cis-trans isomerase [Rhodanobacter sp.]TAM14545.1 MAG: FKBP-type peptidyl-prolyl cis-trans isomerase [Rhodanobacter sp.]TAM37336.1 MAG: FKBP-type peptidyl-prolyl cis-trans isomerase [Rhodanobacter sp.]
MTNGLTRWCAVLVCGLLAGPLAAQEAPKTAAPAKLDKAKLSYAIGYQIGSQFVDRQGQAGIPDIDIATLQRAMLDAYNKRAPSVSMRAMQQQLQAFNQQLRSDAQNQFDQLAATNARKSAAFMARNAKQPGVIQLPSGIQYSVLKRGDGKASPLVTSTVVVNYRGMLIDGTEFDSTWAHGAPVSFTIDRVIPGWRDVIPHMHVGDRWKVVIPPQLAYGKEGALPRIGPNEALVFEIELLAIKPPTTEAATP